MTFTNIFRTVAVLFATALLAAGCNPENHRELRQTSGQHEKVLVYVGGVPISADEVSRRIKTVKGEIGESSVDEKQWQMLQEAALEGAIRDLLLVQAAQDEGIEITEEEMNSSLEQSRSVMGADQFNEMLESRKASAEDFQIYLKNRLLIGRYKERLFGNITVTETDLEKYYAGHGEKSAEPAGVRLEVFRLASEPLARQVYEKLSAEENFENLVAEYSTAVEKAGVRTRLIPYSSMPVDLQAPVKAAEPGNLLPPISTPEGWYVIKVLEKREARTVDYQEVRENYRQALLLKRQNDVLNDWYDRKRQSATIEYVR